MHESGCKATFSREQRTRFLDNKSIEKLERLQQQDEIRKAELPNLSTCPFCDFAAICPPVEEDREFRCHNPECAEVSCRLCKLKSHIPLNCEESKKENGVSERRVIEEARTEALVRTCGKCKTRILKEDGCNKVICTSCYAVLCDYCGKDISKIMYNHFDAQGRAPPGLITGQEGKCPLYDESSKRKDQQVDQAEKDAMSKVRAEHPELSEEDLKIKFAKSVQSPPDRHTRMHRHYHQMMGDMRVPFEGFEVGEYNPLDPGGYGRRAGALHNELREQQAAVRLAQQNLQQQRQAAQQGYQARLAAQQRRQAEQAQRIQQLRQSQQMRAQITEAARVQRRREIAQLVGQAPTPRPLNEGGNDSYATPAHGPLNDAGNEPFAALEPFWNNGNSGNNNDPFAGQDFFGGDNGIFGGNWDDMLGDVPAFNPANIQPIQYANRNENVRARVQELNARQARLVRARVDFAAVQAQRASQRPQRQYRPYLGNGIDNDVEFEGWVNAPGPNDQPPAAAHEQYDWR